MRISWNICYRMDITGIFRKMRERNQMILLIKSNIRKKRNTQSSKVSIPSVGISIVGIIKKTRFRT